MSLIKLFVLLIFTNIAFTAPLSDTPPYSKKYPYNLLTPSYGILSENDLVYDVKRRNPEPYNPKGRQSGALFWQCFSVENVKNKYHTWKEPDEHNALFCDLETWAQRNGETHVFGGRRAKPIEFCRQYVKKWKELTKGEKFVCLDGENIHEMKKEIKGGLKTVQLWIWDKFKTRKGCYSYFEGDCDVDAK